MRWSELGVRELTKIYPNIFRYMQDIQDISTLAQPRAAGPGPARAARGPGRAAAAWPPPPILYISCIFCIYLYICAYIFLYIKGLRPLPPAPLGSKICRKGSKNRRRSSPKSMPEGAWQASRSHRCAEGTPRHNF